ncbi:PAS domain S-box protein [Fulvivirgaceae bacterium BMA12]|uniref:PAS domain S-box protein n=1 Tax=Agaribacillus aureus TaxID=3051825 RepID=A0ABT8L4M3_9BACT|nr:PAS domain S-box protein [Fulvivirgaceae bacterium BMA12]
MKRIRKIEDNLLVLLLASAIISLLVAVIVPLVVKVGMAYVISAIAFLDAVIFGILFGAIRRRFQLILDAMRALEEKNLDNARFARKKGLQGRIIEKLVLIDHKNDEAAELIAKIGEGKEIGEFQHLQQRDNVRMALVEMRDKINSYNDQESTRKWIAEGVARFSEILRQHHEQESEMGFEVISNLVRYVDCNQGGFFIINEEEENGSYLELLASYAYDGRKFQEKKVYAGQGLLGQSMLEKQTVYMTRIPDNYVNITSGLGEATPRNLIIVPLLFNEEFCGAIELASFNILKDYQVEFLEKVAENIAAYVVSVKTNANTQNLLQQSQLLTEELRSREEEMKQNLEELTAAQEEMERKQTELDGIFSAINATMGMAEFDMNGKILAVNESLLHIYGRTQKEVVGQYQDVLLDGQTQYDEICNNLKEDKSNSMDLRIHTKSGDEVWINTSFTAIKDKENRVGKVLMLAQDITTRKQVEKDFEQLSLVADNTDNSVLVTDGRGHIEFANAGFSRLTGYELNEVIGKKPGSFLQGPDTDPETAKRISSRLREAEPIYEEILNYKKDGASYWVSLMINPIFDEEHKVEKFISIQADITETKIKSLDYAYQLEAISRSNAVIEFNKDGIVEAVNENFLNILGYKKEEIIGQHHAIFVDEKTKLSKAYEEHWKKLKNGEHLEGEFKRINKNGQEIWLKGIYNPVFDIQNKLSKIIKFAVDITREKELQIAAQEQGFLLKNQLDTINKTLASIEFDMDGVVRDANEIFLSVTGYEKKELVGKPYTQLIPQSELDKPQTQIMWHNLREGQFFTGEFKKVDKSGKELWLLGTYNPILDQHGKLQMIVMFAQFITKEKEKQLDLRGTVNALKQSLPVMELNSDGTFKNANELFFSYFGYKRLELRNAKFDLFLNGDAGGHKIKAVFKKLEGEECVQENLKLVGKKGSYGRFKTTFYPIKNLENKLCKIVVILVEEKEH